MIVVEILGWAAAAVVLTTIVMQLADRGEGRASAMLHAFTPHLLLAAPLLAILGALLGRWAHAIVFAALTPPAVVLLRTARRPRRSPLADPSSPTLTVLHSNVLFRNRRDPRDVAGALLAIDADVAVLCEMTDTLRAALDEQGALGRYPHRVGHDGRRGEGIAVWSRRPLLATRAVHLGGRDALMITVEIEGTSFDVTAVHAPTPTSRAHGDQWAPALRAIGEIMSARTTPTVIVGDFNAGRWHAPFRSILDVGYRDVHELLGRGFTPSWPLGRRLVPPFVRLDHVLIDDALAPCSLRDVTIPGSDHRGFVVTVALAAR